MLLNGFYDADGKKQAFVHACEADADGALTMQILNLVSGGKPAALLDIRWYDRETGVWTMANCGALPADFAASGEDETGLSQIHLVPHVFGRGGGDAFPFVAVPQQVTLARLCRRNGEYWLAVVLGIVEKHPIEEMGKTTAAFPQAFIRTSAGMDLLDSFGSNHLHMVGGDVSSELFTFCRLAAITCRSWK
jgi:L-fucose isomerase